MVTFDATFRYYCSLSATMAAATTTTTTAAAAAADNDVDVDDDVVSFTGLMSRFPQSQSRTQAKVLHSPSTMSRMYVTF